MDKLNIEKRGLKYGLLTTVGLIAFFFLMMVLGLVHNYHLRALNALIMFTGVYLSIRSYKKARKDGFLFLKGMSVGLLTALVTAVTFTVFVVGYILANPEFMQALKANEPHGIYINEWGVAIIIFIEAAASGFMFSYLSMQWLKAKNMADLDEIPTNYKYEH